MSFKKIRRIIDTTFFVIHGVLLAVMIVLGFAALFRPEIIQHAIDWIGVQIKSWGSWNYLILFVTAIAESFPFVGAVVPGMNVMILVGGFFVAREWDIFPLAALLSLIGACLGNASGYLLGRYSPPETFQKYSAIFGAGPRELAWIEKQVQKNGFWFILGAKFHNLLRSFIPYIAGSHRMSGPKFWLANLIGSAIWAVSILLIGVFAVENYEKILTYFNYIFLGGIVIVVIIYSVKKNQKENQRSKNVQFTEQNSNLPPERKY